MFPVLLFVTGFQFTQSDAFMPTYRNDPYEQEWRQIDSLEQEGLLRSALERSEALYERARTDNNPAQVVKTVIYRGKYEMSLSEDGDVVLIADLEEEAATADFPVRPVLQSMLGELYQNYLDNHMWELSERTATRERVSDDLQTWTVADFNRRIVELYQTSLEDERLVQVPITDFDAITTEAKNVEGLRPTLYDFLVHRAIDQFRNERTYATRPAYAFYLRDETAFADAPDFVAHPFETRDTASEQYKALLLFQDLLRRHLDAGQVAPLIDADLKRLAFAYDKAVVEDKEARYAAALQRLAERYADHPASSEVAYQLASWHADRARLYDPFTATAYQDAFKTAMDVCGQAVDEYPDAYGAGQCRLLMAEIEAPTFSAVAEQVSVPGQPILAKVEYRNIEELELRVVALGDSDFDSLEQKGTEDKYRFLEALEARQQRSQRLPSPGDYQRHSVELALDPLPAGAYALLMQAEEQDRRGILFFYVSSIGHFGRSEGDRRGSFLVVDRQSGAPLEGVEAEFFTTQYNRTTRRREYRPAGTAVSNDEGLVRVELPERNYYLARFSKGEDILFLRDGYNNYYRPESPSAEEERRTAFFLDRAIYRPGQTIYFKGIALANRGDEAPRILTDEPVTVTLYDVNRQPAATLDLRTNAYGTFSGSFRAPAGGLRGQMSLESSLGSSRKNFRVEEYKRPRFEVRFDRLAEEYDLGDEVAVRGTAEAFAGSSVDGALVQYRVVRQVRFPWMPVWRSRSYFLPPMSSEEVEIANGVTTTNADGAFEIAFEAIPDPTVPKEDRPSFLYKVTAVVVDITGETRSAEKQVELAYLGIKATLKVPAAIDRGQAPPLALSTTNLDGQALPAEGTVEIFRLNAPQRIFIKRYWERPDLYVLGEEEFNRRFPHLPYREENEPHTWEAAEKMYEQSFRTPDTERLRPDMSAWPVGHYEARLITADKEGQPVELKRYFVLYDAAARQAPPNMPGWEMLEDGPFQPGEQATLHLATGADRLWVRYELERDREVVDGRWLEIDDWKSMDYEVQEGDRGNVHCLVTYVKYNREHSTFRTIRVPWSNKDLKIEYESFRDKLRPGQEEEWRLKISGPAGERVAAEMVATLYDASLDQFVRHGWDFSPFVTRGYAARVWSPRYFSTVQSESGYDGATGGTPAVEPRNYRHLNWFNLYRFGGYGRIAYRSMALEDQMADGAVMYNIAKSAAAPPPPPPPAPGEPEAEMDEASGKEAAPSELQVRTNLDETAFFLPELRTDAEGNILIAFKMNEALTRWKFLGLAHTKDLEYALTERELVTQKELMVIPNAPRFVRDGDEIELTAKVSNLTESTLTGIATLQLFNGLTMEPVDVAFDNTNPEVAFEAGAGRSARVAWTLRVPAGTGEVLVHRIVARAGAYADGEESALPVLPNRLLVTETMPMALRGKEKKTFTFDRLDLMNRSASLQSHQLMMEFTSNPAWYAVKALPYLMEYPHECAEQVFSRLYANALAGAVVEAHPRIREVFDRWRAQESLQSDLMQHQEFKAVLLEETPWVLEAQSEEAQRKNIALLFELDKMGREREAALRKLVDMQLPSGGFPWFPSGDENWYITQYIVEGAGRLRQLRVEGMESTQTEEMLGEAIAYIDTRLLEGYEKLQREAEAGRADPEEDHLYGLAAHYLYARSFFPAITREAAVEEAYQYYLGQAARYWLNRNIYQQGLIALAMHRSGRKAEAERIVRSLRERALQSDELGMYWKYQRGWFWHELPIETHVQMIEVFDEVAADPATVDELRIWLLKNKQTSHWKTTKATAAAVYALLNQGELAGGTWLAEDGLVEVDFQELRKKEYRPRLEAAADGAEAGTGYYQVRWEGEEVGPAMQEIRVKNPNRGIAWGSLYWQYFEDLDKITTFEDTPLTLRKQLFRKVPSDRGPQLAMVEAATARSPGTRLTPGDLLIVRLELRVDRDMEYVHMKDLRASGLEPVNVLSGYKRQGTLAYYESTGDAATHFFFDYLPRGTYVFEYPLRVSHQGDFSNGITSVQCMYAPEFASHSEGLRLRVAAEEN